MSPRKAEQNEKMRSETLGKIFNAALRVFSEYGYHGATMKNITNASGLSYGLVYHYFPSKAEVFRFLIDSALSASYNGAKLALETPGSPWEKIVSLSHFMVQELTAGTVAPYFLVVLHGLTQTTDLPDFKKHVTQKIEAHYDLLAPLIEQAQADGLAGPGDPRVLSSAYFTFLQGIALLGVQENSLNKGITPQMLLGILRGS